MRVEELDATIRMMLYTDHTYANPYTSAPTIELRDKVSWFVQMSDFGTFHASSSRGLFFKLV